MTGRDEDRLVEHLYDELSPEEESAFSRLLAEDHAALAEVESMEATLSALREGLPAEEPSPHLDAKIFAYAREAAERHQAEAGGLIGTVRKLLRGPAVGIFAAAAAAAVAAFVILPQLNEPSFDSATVVEEAPNARGFAPAPAAPVVAQPEAQAAATPAQVSDAVGDETTEAANKERTASSGRAVDEDQKRVAGKLAKQLDDWERRPAANAAPPKAAEQKVVARFDAPEEPAAVAPAKPMAKKMEVAKVEREADDEAAPAEIVEAKKGAARSEAPRDSLAEGGAGQGAGLSPPAVAVAPAPPAEPRPEPAPAAEKSDRGERAASSVAKAKAQLGAKAGKDSIDGVPQSPAHQVLAEARQKVQSGEPRVADQLAQRAVTLARGSMEEPQVTLEAAEILLATGNYVLAERYAVAAERGLQLAARTRAQSVAKRAKAMRLESDAPAAKPTSDAASESVR